MTHPTDPIQFAGEEPTDYSEFTSASSEDNEYTPPMTLLCYVLAFIFAVAAVVISLGFWLNY